MNFIDPYGLFLQSLFPAHTASFSRNPIGGSVDTQIDYANSINFLRGQAANAAWMGAPAGPIYIGLPLKTGLKNIPVSPSVPSGVPSSDSSPTQDSSWPSAPYPLPDFNSPDATSDALRKEFCRQNPSACDSCY